MENECNISGLGLPGAYFNGAEALAEYRPDAERYEAAVAAYEAWTLDPAELWEELRKLGFDNSEIQWHVDNPGKRMSQGFT